MMRNFRNDEWRRQVTKVVKQVSEQEIRFARLQFTDVNGIPKVLLVPARDLESIFENGRSFDGSSIAGYREIEESDMLAFPDPDTFAVIPWRSGKKSTCRLICDIYCPDGQRFQADPRYVLERAVEECRKSGLEFKCAPELEFFLLKEADTTTPKPIDIGGYFELEPGETTEDLRREIADAAETFGIKIEVAHHEVALGQNEIDFEYGEPVITADRTVTMKTITKAIAANSGYTATYMPKPFMNVNGSGMHVHMSMWSTDGKTNVFFENDKSRNYLSDTALHFIGGQLAHGREMCSVLASWPNSYKRLVPGYEAPVYIAWAFKNRSPLIRVPNFSGRSGAARCEIRCPDPAGNPYLQFAVLCLSGLDGIRKKIDPPKPTEVNVYHMSYEERNQRGIVSLPESLSEALGETEKSEFMRRALGEEAFAAFLKEKHKEWDLYRTQVSSWEFDRYMRKL